MMRTRFTKQLISSLLALLLALVPLTAAFAAPDGALTYDELLANTSADITRGQFAMLLNTYLSLPEAAGDGFDDVADSHPYAAEILTAQATGYMVGDGFGVFRPDDVISGAEAASCVNFFLGFDLMKVPLNEFIAVPDWAKPAASNLLDLRMLTREAIENDALTVAGALDFAAALSVAVMYQSGPYALAQVDENDDFYGYNNRQYLATATASPGYLFAMSFLDPEFVVQDQISTLLADILSKGGAPGSDEWKIAELHAMYMDESGRAESIADVMLIIEEIKAVKSLAEFNALSAKYYPVYNLLGFYDVGSMSDAAADATKWCAIIVPGSFYLGSRDYYAYDESLAPIQEAAKNYVASVLSYAGETDGLESRAAAIFGMEQRNALAQMPIELLYNPDILYTKSSWDEMDKVGAASGILSYSPEVRAALKDASVYCPDMDYIKYVETNYTEENLPVLKDFAIFNTMQTFGMLLGDDCAELTGDLEIAMYGEDIATMDLELRAQMLVTNLMSDAFSKLYAEKYAASSVKTDVLQIIELIRGKYRDRINGLDWMSGETKLKAIEKLDAIKTYAVYPDSYSSKYSFGVKSREDGGNLIDFYFDYKVSVLEQIIDELSKPYTHSLWDDVPTYTVNAYYSPNENAIIIPAGILQEPFYIKDGAREANLGGIGAVIAHEISHAFDNSGAKYDKNGTITNWWTEDDYAAFAVLTDKVAADLSEINFVGDQTVNGVLCTGETIADLGAMACVLDIADDADGADIESLMRSWAHIWAAKMSPEVASYLLSIDEHSPNKVRVNYILPQQDGFYDTFGVTESDGMYIPPEDRIRIW